MRNPFVGIITGLLAAAALWTSTAPARATDTQVFSSPSVQILDPLKIDIASDEYVRNDTFMTIGDPSAGGLAWSYHGHTSTPSLWGDYYGYVTIDTSGASSVYYTVRIGENNIEFNSSFGNLSGTGATLSLSGTTYTYTDQNGVVYNFPSQNLSTINYPNGLVLTLNPQSANCGASNTYCSGSVVSNRGYAFRFDATNNKVLAVNMSAHNCDAQAFSCDAYDNYIVLGSVTDGAGKAWATITDALGNIWQYNVANMYKKKYADGSFERRPPGIFGYKDPKGYFATITRDNNGCISSFTDPRGTFTWTRSFGSSDIVTVKDPSGGILYTASVTGDVICPTGGNQLNYVKDALGNQTTYNIGGIGPGVDGLRLYSITKPEGSSVSYTYDSRGNVVQVASTPKSGSGLGAAYLNANYDSVCTNPRTCNKPNWTQDAKGNKNYYTYDSLHGGLTSVTAPPDTNGLTPKTTTAYAQYTAQIRNSLGSMVNSGVLWLPQSVSTCATAVTCDGSANQLKITTAYGTYNLLSSSVTTSTGDNSQSTTISTTYDNVGNTITIDGPRTDIDDVIYKTYDALRRPIYEIGVDPDGPGPLQRTIAHHIYTNILETQTESGTGNATNGSDFARASYIVTTYNYMGQKTLVASYINGVASAQALLQSNYDIRGRVNCSAVRMNSAVYATISSTDPCTLGATGSLGPDRITKNTYDVNNHVTEIDQAYGVAGTQRAYVRYTYTNDGLKQTETDANGNKTMYVYDGFDRLSQIQYPSTIIGSGGVNASDYEQYGYDANGNRISWRRRDGQTINFSYDNLNRQTLKDLPGTTSGDVYSGYDLVSHIKYNRFGSASGTGTTYYYDGLGRLSYVTDINGRTVYYSYNQASARTQLTFPDMSSVGFGLDNANRVSTIGWNATSGLLSQSYDNLGRLTGQGKGGGSTSYGYDNLGRLISMTNDLAGTTYDVNWTFAYNPVGQISSSSASTTIYDYRETISSSDSPTYDGLNRDARLVGTTSACPSGGYDNRQNLICDGLSNRNYAYDIENRLLTASGSGTGGNATLAYDPEGRLSSYSAGGLTTTFLYDGPNLIAEYNGTSTQVWRRYIHGAGTDNPLIWLEGSSNSDIRWFYTDYHGSVIGYSDGVGNLAQLYKYGPYGEPKDINNNDSWSGSRFRYTGQTMLYEARLYYYKARVYDPKWGRFLQVDPIGSADDLDLYAYVAGDPANKSDPTGLYLANDATAIDLGDSRSPTASVENYGLVEESSSDTRYYTYKTTIAGAILSYALAGAWNTAVVISEAISGSSSDSNARPTSAAAAGSSAEKNQKNWLTYYHGTDGKSVMSIFTSGLSGGASRQQKDGFYLTPNIYVAESFAYSRTKSAGGTKNDLGMLMIRMTVEANSVLRAAGAKEGTNYLFRNGPGYPEFYVPTKAFPVFEALRAKGEIVVAPTGMPE